jgi:predicted PurR-regulated permease PerM
MSFQLTQRERRWLDAILVLAAFSLAYVVLQFIAVIFALFGDLIMVFFLAWLLAFMLSPIIDMVYKIPRITRAGAVLATYLLIFGALVVVTLVVAAALVSSISDFIANLPQLQASLPSILEPWQARIDDIGLQVDLQAQATVFLNNLSQYAVQLAVPLQQLAVASLGAIGNLGLVVILSLYMVADRDRLVAFLFWLVPTGYKAEAEVLEEAVARSFGGFIRGQVVTGLAFAAVCLLASLIFGLDFAPVTTALAGLLMAIPFFGPFFAWAPPVLVAILTKPDTTFWVVVIVAVGWFLVLNVLQPRIMANSLRIHPIVVLGSVLVGIKVAGIPGAVFGIPVAAVLSALFLHALAGRRGPTPVAERAAVRVGRREGRLVRRPREPDPATDRDVEPHAHPMTPGESSAATSTEG